MVYLGQDAITGKKRYTTRTVRGSRREAERVLSRMVADADHGGFARTSATVGDLLERWFAQAREDYSPKTVLETRSYLDRDLLPVLGQVPLSKLQPEDLDRFYRGLRAHGSRGRPLAPGSVRRIHGILRRALQQGVRWGWISVNPAASASPPKVPKTDVKPPTPSDLGRLLRLATADDVDLATFVTLSAATGARRSELLALRWDDLDLVRGVVTISRGIVNGPDGLVEKDTKTHQARRVTLDSATVAVLSSHHEAAVQRARMAQVELPPRALLFSRDGVGRGAVVPGFDHPSLPPAVRASRARESEIARPPSLRGDAAPGRRRGCADCCWAPRSPQRGDDAERVFALPSGGRSPGGGCAR